jgi:propanediol dehydratase large subunit
MNQIIRKDGSVVATIDFENEYVGIADPNNVIPITFEELRRIVDAVEAELMSREQV